MCFGHGCTLGVEEVSLSQQGTFLPRIYFHRRSAGVERAAPACNASVTASVLQTQIHMPCRAEVCGVRGAY